MGTVYVRGGFWWLGFRGPGGAWVYRSSKVPASQPRREAELVLRDVEKAIAADGKHEVQGDRTVADWAGEWTKTRKAHGLSNAQKDLERLTLYVLPRIGGLRLENVRPSHIRELVAGLRARALAPRTVINTYGLVRRLFADAVAEELVLQTPCVLRRGDLPKKLDKDPRWRATAVYSAEELSSFIGDTRIPLDRRLGYAMAGLAGLREGEIAALRWESWHERLQPLGRFDIVASFTRGLAAEKGTKTGKPRTVPVHPELARLVVLWRSQGFQEVFGRAPRPADLLLPNRQGGYRTNNTFLKGLAADLKLLGLRHRRFHDFRRTFITLGRSAGANPDVLKTVTHDGKGDQFDQYTSFPWPELCRAVACIELAPVSHLRAVGTTGPLTTFSTTTAERSDATVQNNTGLVLGQEGTRSRFRSVQQRSSPVIQATCEATEEPRGPGEAPECSNVGSSDGVLWDLERAANEYRASRDRRALATRLRWLISTLRDA